MAGASNVALSVSAETQDYEYWCAVNINVSNFVSVKLSGKHNYLLWEAQMLPLLDSINMRGIVEDSFYAPRNCRSETMRRYASLVKGWIFGSLSQVVLEQVHNLDSVKDVWEKLKSIYGPLCLPPEMTTIDINEVQDQSPPVIVNEDTQECVNRIRLKKKLHDATVKGDWLQVKLVLKKDEGLATEAISSDGSTVLHMAVGIGHNHIVKKLLSYINNEQVLQQRDSDGSTALHIAANVGNKHGAAHLVKKNKMLLRIQDHRGKEPLHKACQNMHLDTTAYLLKVVGDAQAYSVQPDDEIGAPLLINAITAKQYSLALILVQKFPTFVSKSDEVLMAIAKNFPGGASFIPFVSNKKNEAKKVLELVCNEINKLTYSGTHHPYYTRLILEAARQNADEIVREIIIRAPEAIKSTDENGYDFIQLGIIHRSEKIIKFIDDMGELKNRYRTMVDSSKNTILHLAAKPTPSSVHNQRTNYPALELQRSLQWMEVVKKLILPTGVDEENIFKETAYMVFTREHENLVKEGERWMKTIAKSCSIIAALNTTLLFTALITIPYGSYQEKGTPLLETKAEFVVFIITDAFSLFVSSASLLVFLSIIASCFDEKDFVLILPRRLLIGLFCLLLSTISMMVALTAILFLVFRDQKPWILAPICGLAFIPVAFFVTLQLPLMVDLFRSTYLSILGTKRKRIRRSLKSLVEFWVLSRMMLTKVQKNN